MKKFLRRLGNSRKDNRRRLKSFLRSLTPFQLKVLVKGTILIPIVAACVWYAGWLGLIGSLLGIVVGEWICRRFLK